jgi:hypothetical protein
MPDEPTEQLDLQITIKNQALIKKLKSLPARRRSLLILELLEEKLLSDPVSVTPAPDISKLTERIDKIETTLEQIVAKISLFDQGNIHTVSAIEEPANEADFDPLHNDIVNTVNAENLFNKLNRNFL